MPTDLTGTPTSLGIGTYNVDADAPSGLGFNAAMSQIDALIASRIGTPAGITTGEIPVWNGSTWVRSSTLRPAQSSLATGTPGILTFLRGDGAWQKGSMSLLYDSVDAGVTFPTTSITTPTLDQNFAHLMIVWSGKAQLAAADNMFMRVNGDAGANYSYQDLFAVTSTATAASSGGPGVSAGMFVGSMSQNSGFDSSGVIFMPGYSRGQYTQALSISMGQQTVTPTWELLITGGIYRVPTATTTITLLSQSGSGFNSGRYTVYGIPG